MEQIEPGTETVSCLARFMAGIPEEGAYGKGQRPKPLAFELSGRVDWI